MAGNGEPRRNARRREKQPDTSGHKKRKVQDVGTSRGDADSDDDFVDPPPEFGGRPRNYSEEHREASPELELTPEEDQMFPTIETRGSIKVLYNVIKSLNGRQRRAVRDIGFGGLLSLDIKETPLRLGRWLLTNYNPVDRVLNLENGNALISQLRMLLMSLASPWVVFPW
nr:uncharacterized protein LOC109155364 [Ipomoea trifida]